MDQRHRIYVKHSVDKETRGEYFVTITGQGTMKPGRSYFGTPTIAKSAFGFVLTQPALERYYRSCTRKRKKY